MEKVNLPEGWKFERLGDLVSIKTGKLDANASDEKGEFPFFTCSKEPLKISSYSYDCECVLVAGNGDLNIKYYNGKFDAYQRTYIIECDDKKSLIAKYLYYFMNIYVDKLRLQSIGGVIKYIRLANLTEAIIPLPPLKIQKQIVSVLEKAESVLEKRNEAIRLLDELVKSKFIEMFGEPNTNSKGWKQKKIVDICINKDSNRIPLKQSDRDKRHGKYPYYGATGIIDYIDDYIFEGLHLLIAEDGKNLETKNKDIAFLAQGRFWVNNHAHVIIETTETNLYYLKFVINNINLKPYITGIDQLKLNRSNLDSIVINVPPIELQNKFSNVIRQVDKLKFEMEESLRELENNFNSLMQKAFKGELDFN